MSDNERRFVGIIKTTMSCHPLFGSGCLCGEGPRKYDVIAHEQHLAEKFLAALKSAKLAIVEASGE